MATKVTPEGQVAQSLCAYPQGRETEGFNEMEVPGSNTRLEARCNLFNSWWHSAGCHGWFFFFFNVRSQQMNQSCFPQMCRVFCTCVRMHIQMHRTQSIKNYRRQLEPANLFPCTESTAIRIGKRYNRENIQAWGRSRIIGKVNPSQRRPRTENLQVLLGFNSHQLLTQHGQWSELMRVTFQ